MQNYPDVSFVDTKDTTINNVNYVCITIRDKSLEDSWLLIYHKIKHRWVFALLKPIYWINSSYRLLDFDDDGHPDLQILAGGNNWYGEQIYIYNKKTSLFERTGIGFSGISTFLDKQKCYLISQESSGCTQLVNLYKWNKGKVEVVGSIDAGGCHGETGKAVVSVYNNHKSVTVDSFTIPVPFFPNISSELSYGQSMKERMKVISTVLANDIMVRYWKSNCAKFDRDTENSK